MRRRSILLHQLGLFGLVFGLSWLHAARLAPEPYALLSSPRLPWTILFAAILSAGSYAVGLPDLGRRRLEIAFQALLAFAVATLVVSVFQFSLKTPLLPRSVIGLVGVLFPVWSVLVWNLATDLLSIQTSRDRVLLVVGKAEDASAVSAELVQGAERPVSIVGHVLVDDLAVEQDGQLEEVWNEFSPSLLVLDVAAQANPVVVAQASRLHAEGARVRTLSLFYEEWLGKLPLSELEKVALLFDIGEVHRTRYVRTKRVADIAIGAAGMLALLPIGLVIGMLNPILNPGPLMYRQERVGKNGTVFSILKFRSMKPAPPGDTHWTTKDDPRVTALGRFMRRTHLDELPQLVNILRGDLSIVGPRPEQVHYVEELRTKLPFYDARLLVRPGLTGWAQIKFGYAGTESDAVEKLQYDLFYLRRQGLAFDMKILVRTARHLVTNGGR